MYRKLSRESRVRRSMLAGITKDIIMNEAVVTTEARAKEVRKFVDKMITYGKRGTLVSRRKALSFLNNDISFSVKLSSFNFFVNETSNVAVLSQ